MSPLGDWVDRSIKWTRLESHLCKAMPAFFNRKYQRLYRPFVVKHFVRAHALLTRYQLPLYSRIGTVENSLHQFQSFQVRQSLLQAWHTNLQICISTGENQCLPSTATPPTASGSATSPSGACARSTTTTGRSGAPALTSAIPTASAPRTSSPTPTPCSTTRCTATTTASTCSASSPACPSTASLMLGTHGAGTAGPAPGL